MRTIIAYEIDGNKYFVGTPKKVIKDKIYLEDACILKKMNLLPGKNLEDSLRKSYLREEKEEKVLIKSKIISPHTLF